MTSWQVHQLPSHPAVTEKEKEVKTATSREICQFPLGSCRDGGKPSL